MGRLAARRGIVYAAVAGLALYESGLLSTGLLLGYLGMLRAPTPLLVWGSAALALLAFAVAGFRSFCRAARAALTGARPRPVDALLAISALVAGYLVMRQVAQDWIIGTWNFDSLAYHIPRALQWSWHGDYREQAVPQWQQVGLPIGGDVVLLPGVFLGIGWLGGCWTALWLTLGATAAVFASARSLGAGRRAALVGALAFLSFPTLGMRLVDVNSDIAAAFPLLAAWALVSRSTSIAEAAFLFPALCGAGVASKANVAPAVPVLALALFGTRLRELGRDRRALAAAAAGTAVATLLCVGSFLPVYRLFGDLFGGGEGKAVTSYNERPLGILGIPRAIAFGVLHWVDEPFALIPEPPRFELYRRAGLPRAYSAIGLQIEPGWYPALLGYKNRSGVFPALALPWLLAALPRGRRKAGLLLFAAIFLSLVALLGPNEFGSRFLVVVLAAFAVLWSFRASRSPWLVAALLLASFAVDTAHLDGPTLKELSELPRPVPSQNRFIAAAVGADQLWMLNGPLTLDAVIAGPRADVRFEYLTCPADHDFVRLFREIRQTSPWLLLNVNSTSVATGPQYPTKIGPPCPVVEVEMLKGALASAGWAPSFKEFGYQIWSAVPRRP
jgi:hypothetical protein